MDAVREVADKLEKVVPDDLWPLPKYSEVPLHQVARSPPRGGGRGPSLRGPSGV